LVVLIVGIADTCDSEFHNLLNVCKDTENISNYQTKDFRSSVRISFSYNHNTFLAYCHCKESKQYRYQTIFLIFVTYYII
jgi:hypothetical protein